MNGPHDLARAAEAFHENGFVVLPSIIPVDAAEHLRVLTEQRYQDPQVHAAPEELDLLRGDVSMMRVFECDPAFREMIDLEPLVTLVEALLGPDCHVIAQNALRIPPGKGIINWHIDDALFFPFLSDTPTVPAVGSIPCFALNVMIALSDIDDVQHGPTQVIPGSHLSGRRPPYSSDLPGAPTSLLARAGDAYLVNSQTWHRGAPNQSDRTRYLLTTAYGRRFISQRFYPFIGYRLPDGVLEGASARVARLLGRHGKGPYG
ncbi:phytanoyl-CoA dioxygenase family protein [Streptomyces sp. NBC_01244]|uniref:phytanoyl-CoA dioxygenase family protein n=1 Tax=Streptomyces sp. NBC_01244 TaxID=2903797 RepID=UPI002E0EE4DE|nr:phytanoyl-CoA dioxygenase family protein [Streptomyces sp. NBC_01244]